MARQEGLSEETVALIDDGYESRGFTPAEVAVLQLTDAIVGDPRSLPAAAQEALATHFTAAQVAELGLGIALFHALSKVLIVLGLEPESMPVTIVPTPGTAPRDRPSGR